MIFSGLSEKLQDTFRKLKRKGKLSEKDVDAALREVRLALLEADVNYKVVKNFTSSLKERAIGAEVLKSLTPGQQVIKIVHEELVNLMGAAQKKIAAPGQGPQTIMLVGLQGSGKTTTAAKLSLFLKKNGHRPLLAAADVYRPAAIDQLIVLGSETGIPVYSLGKENPVKIATQALSHAEKENHDYVILDTAGRLHINEELMAELGRIKEKVQPAEILLVVDAMTGQDAVNVAASFHEQLGLTGVILTKLDGDTRGGAALSVKEVTGCPIKFTGQGEKVDAFEPFFPERMASRILGMGDVLSLIEKAQDVFDEEKGRALEKKLRTQTFTLEDFLEQLQYVKQMGPLENIVEMLPGIKSQKGIKNLTVDEKQLARVEAIIKSMTKEERQRPEILNSSRRRRIAGGSGTTVQEVNRILKQFDQMKKMVKQVTSMEKGKGVRKKKGLFPF